MTGHVPREIRERIQQKLWAKADELNWIHRSDIERAGWYANWVKDKEIGGILAHFMDPRRVRVYLKDTLLKPYQRARLERGIDQVLIALDVDPTIVAIHVFKKPHGRVLADGRVVCWGNSRDWKTIIVSVFERSRRLPSTTSYGAALLQADRMRDAFVRNVADEMSQRLGVAKLVWLD